MLLRDYVRCRESRSSGRFHSTGRLSSQSGRSASTVPHGMHRAHTHFVSGRFVSGRRYVLGEAGAGMSHSSTHRRLVKQKCQSGGISHGSLSWQGKGQGKGTS